MFDGQSFVRIGRFFLNCLSSIDKITGRDLVQVFGSMEGECHGTNGFVGSD